jgi:hypothetical protein
MMSQVTRKQSETDSSDMHTKEPVAESWENSPAPESLSGMDYHASEFVSDYSNPLSAKQGKRFWPNFFASLKGEEKQTDE